MNVADIIIFYIQDQRNIYIFKNVTWTDFGLSEFLSGRHALMLKLNFKRPRDQLKHGLSPAFGSNN